MYSWLWMVIASGITLGFWDITKKKAFEKNTVLNVLAFYSLFCFIFVSFDIKNAFMVSYFECLMIFIKTFIVFLSWSLSFTAINKLPISVITPFDTINPIFAVIFGIFLLNEKITAVQCIGIAVMLLSYYFIGKVGSKEVVRMWNNKYFYYMVAAAVLNAVSATLDKVILKKVNPGQIQFWFCFFMTVLYMSVLMFKHLVKKDKLNLKPDIFIPLMSLILVISDRVYFTAVNVPASKIAVIMPLRKISVFVSVIIGGIIFKEKNLKQKFCCICILIAGIILLFSGK